ncbi:MAG TPA: hypothetical protein DEQ34_13880 [Balneolaceae bacterium]|nr:hypothetical protein [Balneolaceae bacterium]|tara:strand:+ start:28908 stop:30194 length:1287 start_codon:yes stop_codon:yes gene_type:complete
MNKKAYSLFSAFMVAFLLLSCTGDPLITPIQEGINSQNYDAAIAAADSAIALQPQSGVAYYYKGVALGKKAETIDEPSDRLPVYEDMRESLDDAKLLFSASTDKPKEAGQVTNLVLSTWSTEHNAAIPYATNDSVMATVENPLELAIAHLVNAVTINPDSLLSHDVLAQIYYMNDNYEGAASEMSKVIELQDSAASSEYDRLGYYLLQSGHADKAVEALEEGLALYPDSVTLVQKIADAYFKIGRVDDALVTVERLIKSDPNNAQYRLVIGSQLYQQVLDFDDVVDENNEKIAQLEEEGGNEAEIEKLKAENAELETKMATLTDRAEQALLKAVELDDQLSMAFNTLGVLYQNKAAALFDERNNTLDNDEADRLDALAKDEVRKAMGYYEKVIEINPDDTVTWETLFRIYTLLDMRDEAEEAMNKAGM